MHEKGKVNEGLTNQGRQKITVAGKIKTDPWRKRLQDPKAQHSCCLNDSFRKLYGLQMLIWRDILSIYYTVTGGTSQLKAECLPWRFTCIVVNFCTAAKLLWRAWRFVCFYKYAGLSGYTKQWLWCAISLTFDHSEKKDEFILLI